MRRTVLVTSLLALGCGALGVLPPAASADEPTGQLVSEVAAAGTPHVLDGSVYAVAQVGDTMVLGGSFTRARNDSGDTTTLVRNGLVAFSASTGKISTTFAPSTPGTVRAVIPAGDGSTVYVAGGFTSVGGVARQRVARVRVSDGAVISSFNAGAVTGQVRDLALRDGRLWLAGAFTHVGGRAQAALTTVDPTTGAPSSYMALPLAGNHHDGSTQVLKIDISPDGDQLVAVGNFDTLAGVRNHQLLTLDLSGAAAAPGGLRTAFYETSCSSAFDTYMRDVDFAPDGSFFVVSTTGAYGGPDVACDTAARFDAGAVGADVRPSWIDHTGGDTSYAVEVTPSAVYIGGHQRWWNNPFAGDRAGPGAVPREGIAALDPANGLPLAWNPGRDKGVGVFDLLYGPQGLWVASDTDRIGDFQYKGRIARLPLTGATVPGVATPGLPGDVYLGGPADGADPAVLYRVNAGGPSLLVASGPDWQADTTADPAPWHNQSSNRAGYGSVPTVDGTVPAGTPREVFDDELWDPAGGAEQSWDLPVPAGTPVSVRLYFANRCTCTAGVGQRVFDVAIDGTTVLDDLDLVAAAGHDDGTMRAFAVTSDGTVDVDLTHVVENPLLSGIEIVRTDLPPAPTASLTRRTLSAVPETAGAASAAPTGGLDWNAVRGSFMVNSALFLAHADGSFTRRTFTGTSYGAAAAVDTSDQVVPLADWHADVQAATGMFFQDGRIYFTRAGSAQLFYRYFSPQSGVVGAQRRVASGNVAGIDFASVRGMFVSAAGHLYWASADGDLHRADWVRGGASGRPVAGTAQVVSGPGVDGATWGARSMFLFQGPGGGGPPTPPTAAFASSCTGLSCTFDASGSTAPESSITSWAWQFGDGQDATGAAPTHVFPAAGTYQVTLTVTSAAGAVDSEVHDVTVTAPAGPQFVGALSASTSATTHRVAVPTAVQAGDTLLLYVTLNSTDVAAPAAPAGWTLLDTVTGTGVQGRVWSRTALASDAGSLVGVSTSATVKGDLAVQAYRLAGGSAVLAHAASVDQASGSGHTTPAVTLPAAAIVVSRWVAKASDVVTWTLPAGQLARTSAAGTGGGRLVSVGADRGSAQPAGAAGGVVASSAPAVTRTVMFTTAIGPD